MATLIGHAQQWGYAFETEENFKGEQTRDQTVGMRLLSHSLSFLSQLRT